MNFKNWLNENNIIKPLFASWSKDGIIVVYIGVKKYIFNIDPIFHQEIRKKAKYRPFEALNLIKKFISMGHGIQEEPKIEPKQVSNDSQNKKNIQKTLF